MQGCSDKALYGDCDPLVWRHHTYQCAVTMMIWWQDK